MKSAGLRFALPIVGLVLLAASSARPGDFEKEVYPLLQKRCLECHGGVKVKAGLRLDSREGAMKGGKSGPVIVPGRSAASELIRRVSSPDKDEWMPPKGERLTAGELALLREWIDSGAAWPPGVGAAIAAGETHWALRPLAKPGLPRPRGHPIDAFIDARLAEQGLRRSPQADPRTLMRRLYFDLTGLPPTPSDVEAFAKERDAEGAYAALVDRLLASPRHGEHWARHWLDVVHYADTHGNDHDYARPNAWPYRDYVIRSLNEDKPYARFIREQVAGDALFPEDPQATVALGFLAAGPWDDTLMVTVREDTVDHRMGQNLDRDNMVSTVMSTFSSLTVHCARCHDHKFDPISQREYYGLQAVFAGVDRADRPVDADPATRLKRKTLQARKGAVAARDAAVLASPEVTDEVAALTDEFARQNEKWQALEVIEVVSAGAKEGTTFAREADGSWFVGGTRPEMDTFIITAQTKLARIRALRLEVLPDPRLPQGGPGRFDNGNFHLAQFRASARAASGESKGAVKLAIARAVADHSDAGDVIANAIDGKPETYWSIHPLYNQPHEAVFELKEPAGYDAGTTLTIHLDFTGKTGHQIGRFRLWASTDAGPLRPIPAPSAALLRIPEKDRTTEQRRDLALQVLAAGVERELSGLPAPQFVYAATQDFTPQGSFKPALKPRPIHLLTRGDINKPRELVGPGALGCVPGLPRELAVADQEGESARRAALARWLSDDANVLTWRSIVNRVWHYHFGRGLSDTPSDFGKMGGAPSHPGLIDWLAVWFRDEAKGSLKALHRLIVTSGAYRQESGIGGRKPGAAAAADSDNRLLWHMNRARLTGEEVRDAVLQFSARLDLSMGGPAAIQFVHHGKATFNTDGAPPLLDYDRFDPDAPENRRRAVYRFVFRTVPDPLMDALDCPDGGAMTPVRGVSSTAVQALAMLNNAFLIRQCDHIAARLERESSAVEQQVAAAFRLMLQRGPREKELAALTAYVKLHGLANACHVLLNSNEFLYVD